jgi:sugar/nucleoside kinase (ribokinase family)
MARSSDLHFDYVTVGHVTRDALEHPRHGAIYRVGGSAFYSALQAARLGLRTLIVTQGVPDEIATLLAPYREELEVCVIAAEHTTTLSTRGVGATRTQRVLAWAGAITEPVELDTAILHLAPVARETPVSWEGHAGFVGITPQGLVRSWRESEDVPLVQLDAGSLLGDIPLVPPDRSALAGDVSAVALDPKLLPESFDAAVISEQECQSCHVAVTAGARPTTVHLPTPGSASVTQTPLPPIVAMRDDVGAGDVFAAAFFIALAEGGSPLQAAVFANAVAAARVAGVGPQAIGRRTDMFP